MRFFENANFDKIEILGSNRNFRRLFFLLYKGVRVLIKPTFLGHIIDHNLWSKIEILVIVHDSCMQFSTQRICLMMKIEFLLFSKSKSQTSREQNNSENNVEFYPNRRSLSTTREQRDLGKNLNFG